MIYTDLSKPEDIKNFFLQRIEDFKQGSSEQIKEGEWAKQLSDSLKFDIVPGTGQLFDKRQLTTILVDLLRLEALDPAYLSSFSKFFTTKEIRQLKSQALSDSEDDE